MPTVSSTKNWISVPDNSTFILTTTADPPNVSITITIKDGNSTKTWTTADVLNKTKELTLRSPRVYTMAITIEFAGSKTTLDFDARIKKPNGDPHGKPFKFSATRPPNVHHADIGIEMEP
jgi:hypothetical protein